MKPQGGLESDFLRLLRGPTTINITARPRGGGAGCPKVSAPPADGRKMSLDISFIGLPVMRVIQNEPPEDGCTQCDYTSLRCQRWLAVR